MISHRDLKEELKEAVHREQDCQKKVQEREKQLERIAFDHTCDKNDLQLALQRIADLQYALQDDDDDDDGESSDRYFCYKIHFSFFIGYQLIRVFLSGQPVRRVSTKATIMTVSWNAKTTRPTSKVEFFNANYLYIYIVYQSLHQPTYTVSYIYT